MPDEMNDFELMGDALAEVQDAFGHDYEVGPDLACPYCGTYGFCDCCLVMVVEF